MVKVMEFNLRGFKMNNRLSLSRMQLLPATLRDALDLTFQLKRTFDEGRPISEALYFFVAKREKDNRLATGR